MTVATLHDLRVGRIGLGTAAYCDARDLIEIAINDALQERCLNRQKVEAIVLLSHIENYVRDRKDWAITSA